MEAKFLKSLFDTRKLEAELHFHVAQVRDRRLWSGFGRMQKNSLLRRNVAAVGGWAWRPDTGRAGGCAAAVQQPCQGSGGASRALRRAAGEPWGGFQSSHEFLSLAFARPQQID